MHIVQLRRMRCCCEIFHLLLLCSLFIQCKLCPDINVRLSNVTFGTVEVCYNEQWGSVCSDDWDLTDGNVLCQQLGYPKALTVHHSAYYGTGSGPILMDNVQCEGSENRLDQCMFKGWGISDCSHDDDAGVACKVSQNPNPVNLDARILSNTSFTTGLVELYYDSKWLPVCDINWNKEEGLVFCKQISFPSLVNSFPSNAYGGSQISQALTGIVCSGSENAITECDKSNLQIISNSDCNNAAIICSDSPSPIVTIRLVEGSTQWDGRIEILNNKIWVAVCGNNWTLLNADVACHQLGYQSAIRSNSVSLAEELDTVWLSGVMCGGGEGSLLECNHGGIGKGTCNEYAEVICADVPDPLSLRLVDGSSDNEGRVEILFGDSWGTVCDDNWDLSDAEVVCKQLGYDHAIQAIVTLSQYPPFNEGSGMIWMDDVDCHGNESELADCTFLGWGQHNCDHSEDAGVVCSDTPTSTPPVFSLRLVNGSDVNSGRVEIKYSDVWGTICDDGWDINDANVVCQELLLGNALNAYSNAEYGEGIGPIWLDEVSCSPGSKSLSSCVHNELNHSDCSHAEDAGVSCEGPECVLRLSDGAFDWQGIVYVRIKGEWRGVCNTVFDEIDARVACRQLGYDNVFSFGRFRNISKYWIDRLQCSGSENKLCDCPSSGIGQVNDDCVGFNGVEVTCSFADPFDVRLVGGKTPWGGRVEVRVNDVWGSGCGDWNKNILQVMCKQLGYSSALIVNDMTAGFGDGMVPFWLSDLECSGTEESIFNCTRDKFKLEDTCNVNNVANVLCDPGDNVPSLDHYPIRLMDGTTPYEGRVEILYKGVWGTVCEGGAFASWGYSESHVVCRQMGFGPALTARVKSFSAGSGLILLDDIQCSGSENYLTECLAANIIASDTFGVHNCFHSEDIGVNCSVLSSDVLPVSLTNGVTASEGVVEVFYGGVTGLVCGDNWTLTNAHVICRQLGYTGALKITANLKSQSDLEWFWFGNVDCYGNEARLFDCNSSGLGNANCSSKSVAMVTCDDYPEGSIRLMGGATSSEGRLEIYFSGRWGTVCENGWGARSAEIVCKELGFNRLVRKTDGSLYTYDGANDSPVWLEEVQCEGDEERLSECPHGPLGTHLCSHEHDVGIICTDEPYYPVRLVNLGNPSDKENEGCVQLFYNDTWGSLCNTSTMTANDADTICRTLGFPSADSFPSCYGYPSISDYSLPVWLSNIDCTGQEVSIAECSHTLFGAHTCEEHTKDVSVRCKGTTNPVRLRGGRNISEGRIEVYHNGEWGVVCGDFFDNNDATVICKQLGFYGVEEIVDVSVFGGGGRVLVDDLSCTGTEDALADCGIINWGFHNCLTPDDVGLICTTWSPDRVGTVRLIRGPDSGSGRLEVFQNSFWGTVCNKAWTINESHVVCRELGYSKAITTVDYRSYGLGGGPIKLGSVNCNGEESLLNDCTNNTDLTGCTHTKDVGIVCEKPVVDQCTDKNLRLRGGPTEFTGLLEICHQGHWGTVCNDGTFNSSAVSVTCKSLGHASNGGSLLYGAVYAEGDSVIWLSKVACNGDESSLDNCTHLEYGSLSSSCYGHSQDVNIHCLSISTFMIRLSDTSQGRVEVFYSGKWGTVCDTMWDQNDANVVCRQLGYMRAERSSSGSEFGPSWGPVWMDNVACDGDETSLEYCGHNQWGVLECSHENEAGAICTDSPIQTNPSSPIRIVGTTPLEGRVEVLYDGKWGTVCYNGWDFLDALVVCKQAGYPSVESIRIATANDGSVSDSFPIWLSDLECSGEESNIALCDSRGWGSHDCSHDQDAAVVCSNNEIQSSAFNIRLSNGNSNSDGRLEVMFNGVWGRICSDFWDIRDGDVACKQLGYTGARTVKIFTTLSSLEYVWMDGVHCTGQEKHLSKCNFYGWGHANSSCHDAGVECETFSGDSLDGNYEIRLVDGTSEREGRVEIFYGGIWGSVCDTNWSLVQANVVCHQLGYSGAVAVYKDSWYGPGNGIVIMDGVDCVGDESRLADCYFKGWGHVNEHCILHTNDVSIECDALSSTSVSIKLVNNSTATEGLIQVYYSGRWGLICGNNWGDFDAKVVCRQLFGENFGSSRATRLSADLTHNLVWLDNVQCNGSESSLGQCSNNGWAVHSCLEDSTFAGVTCQYKDPPLFSLRLIGGSNKYEGRVQTFFNSKWGSVCRHEWDFNDARVACRQLGFADALRAVTNPGYGNAEEVEEYFLDDVKCSGDEPGLQYCDSSGFGSQDCSIYEVAGVICTDSSHYPVVTVKLESNSSKTKGLIQVMYNNTWGTVCSENWDLEDAHVICRQLGYEMAISTFTAITDGYSVTGTIWISRSACRGNETSIGDCLMESIWGENTCTHEQDMAVECSSVETAVYPLRLIFGPNESSSSGRLQVLRNGTWGRVCVTNKDFTVSAGNVACKQLGYEGIMQVLYGSEYGEPLPDEPLWITNVQCNGDESDLGDCDTVALAGDNDVCIGGISVMCEVSASPSDNTIRLVNDGITLNKGRVEVFVKGSWGAVCDDFWNDKTASVVCRQVGYTGPAIPKSEAEYGESYYEFVLDDVDCNGNETKLTNCMSGTNPQSCEHGEEASVECSNVMLDSIMVRLSGGNEISGLVEILIGTQWGYICADQWTMNEANVVCRQLGFRGVSVNIGTEFVLSTPSMPLIGDVNCFGNEERLQDCYTANWNIDTCTSGTEYAGVTCEFTEDTARLSEGHEGRVEVYINKQWGSVCDNGWSLPEADVVCRELGYPRAQSVKKGAWFGEGSGPVWLDGVQCNGKEESILFCSYRSLGNDVNCNHDQDVAVICAKDSVVSSVILCATGSVRLIDGITDRDGRVEVCLNNEWIRVCQGNWDFRDAAVVCNQLGYPIEGAIGLSASSQSYRLRYNPILLGNMHCTGKEGSLLNCDHTSSSRTLCGNNQDAAILCSLDVPQPLSVRLTGSFLAWAGKVEIDVFGNNRNWGSVCSNQWDIHDAVVVCQQLGYSDAIGAIVNPIFGKRSSNSPFVYTDVLCIGLENGLSNCIHSEDTGTCDQSMSASVVCTNGEETPQTSLQLLDGPSDSEGRLEIMFAGLWGEVCFIEWGLEESDVACRQLGFWNSVQFHGLSPPSGAILWLSGVNCTGSESTLAHCNHNRWGEGSCITSVWLMCGGNVSKSMKEEITPYSEIPISSTVPDDAGNSQAIASFDLLLAVIIVAVVCGLFLIGMIGFCIAFVVYRWKWYSRTYKIPITSRAERQEMVENELNDDVVDKNTNRRRARNTHGSVSSEMHLLSHTSIPNSPGVASDQSGSTDIGLYSPGIMSNDSGFVLNDLQKCSSLPRHGVKMQLMNPPLRKSIIVENDETRRVVQDGAEQTHV